LNESSKSSRLFLISGSEKLSFAQFNNLCMLWRQKLLDMHLVPKSMIAFLGQASANYLAAVMASFSLECTVVFCSTRDPIKTTKSWLADLGCSFLQNLDNERLLIPVNKLSIINFKSIKIDPQNNIWVASPSQGVYVLLDNTMYWPNAEGIRAVNTPLLSDQVSDIVFDAQRGLAYIATSSGINVLKIPFSDGRKTFSNLKVFPSPFYIPSVKPLVISGAVQSSSLLVTTITGTVIRSIRHSDMGIHGDQILWDGRNERGQLIGSGVYILSVYDQNGSNVVEKITVIRK